MFSAADYEGRLYHKLGNTEKAVEAYETLLQLNSANIDTYYKLIRVKGVEITKDCDTILSKDD